MKILAVDTSGMTASVAIAEDEKTIAQFSMNHKRTHSEKLLPMIDFMLKTALWEIGEIDLFVVAKGPGSFTGLRWHGIALCRIRYSYVPYWMRADPRSTVRFTPMGKRFGRTVPFPSLNCWPF